MQVVSRQQTQTLGCPSMLMTRFMHMLSSVHSSYSTGMNSVLLYFYTTVPVVGSNFQQFISLCQESSSEVKITTKLFRTSIFSMQLLTFTDSDICMLSMLNMVNLSIPNMMRIWGLSTATCAQYWSYLLSKGTRLYRVKSFRWKNCRLRPSKSTRQEPIMLASDIVGRQRQQRPVWSPGSCSTGFSLSMSNLFQISLKAKRSGLYQFGQFYRPTTQQFQFFDHSECFLLRQFYSSWLVLGDNPDFLGLGITLYFSCLIIPKSIIIFLFFSLSLLQFSSLKKSTLLERYLLSLVPFLTFFGVNSLS